jgi:hypothetical protein
MELAGDDSLAKSAYDQERGIPLRRRHAERQPEQRSGHRRRERR